MLILMWVFRVIHFIRDLLLFMVFQPHVIGISHGGCWRLLQAMSPNLGYAMVVLTKSSKSTSRKEAMFDNRGTWRGFRDVVTHCRLLDLGFSSNKFTWFMTKKGGIKVKLDRALGNP